MLYVKHFFEINETNNKMGKPFMQVNYILTNIFLVFPPACVAASLT